MKLRLGLPVVNKDKIFQMIRNGQEADGGWKKEGAKTSDLETTYRVMRAMVLAKERPKNTFKLGEFLASCRNADGGYGTAPGEPSSVSGDVLLLGRVEVAGDEEVRLIRDERTWPMARMRNMPFHEG